MTTSDLVGSHIETLKPYVPGKPIEELERELGVTDPIKLASNENPLGPSPKAMRAMQKMLKNVHYYPDGAAHEMIEAVSAFHNVRPEEVINGNGSDEILTVAVRTFCEYGRDSAVISEHSFAAYGIRCQSHNLEIRWVSTDEGLGYDLGAMAEAIDETTKILFIANPNNPTGTYLAADDLRHFLRSIPEHVVVVVDEAYHQYVEAEDYDTALSMRDEHERLIVTRTLSKCYGLAGVRAGYAISSPAMIDRMNRVREPFNSNSLAQVALPAALSDREFVERSVAINRQGRTTLEAGLEKLAPLGVDWIRSQTNFLLVQMPVRGRTVYDELLKRGVIVRPMDGYGLPKWLRISLAEEQKMKRCIAELGAVLEELDVEVV